LTTVFSDALYDRVGVWLSKNGFGFDDRGGCRWRGARGVGRGDEAAGCLSVRATTSWTVSGAASALAAAPSASV
jgi:hypothetical protein